MKETTDDRTCSYCAGCGRVATSEAHEPWSAWEELPPGSDLAVRTGLVRPVQCPVCGGTGKHPRTAEEAMKEVEAIVDPINRLRADEGSAVTINCPNPYDDGLEDMYGRAIRGPAEAIDVFGLWDGKWTDRRFYGKTLAEALAKAEAAKGKEPP